MLKYTTAFRVIFVIASITGVLGRGYLIPSTSQERSAENELAQPRLDGHIVDGNKTTIQKYPFTASVQVRTGLLSYRHVGGGTIISDRYVLTTGRCVFGHTLFWLKVRVGSSQTDKGGKLMQVCKIVMHEKYNNTNLNNDFALLRTCNKIEFDETKQPAKLPKANNELLDGQICTIVDWVNTQNTTKSPKTLREVSVEIVNLVECKGIYDPLVDTNVCTGPLTGGLAACSGDNGGPLVCRDVSVAAVSWGLSCTYPGSPAVSENVATALDWISDNTGV